MDMVLRVLSDSELSASTLVSIKSKNFYSGLEMYTKFGSTLVNN